VHNSAYTTIDKETKAVISYLYGPTVSLHLVSINKQEGDADCGSFAIANATTLALRLDPAEITSNKAILIQIW